MIGNLKDFYLSSWKYLIRASFRRRKMPSMRTLLRILFLCIFLEVWPYMRKLRKILIVLWIRLCSLGFFWRILILMPRYSRKSVSSLWRLRSLYTKNHQNKYTWCTKIYKQPYPPQTHQNYQNPHNPKNK